MSSTTDVPVSKSKEGNGEAETQPRSLAIAKKGIRTSADFAEMMSALMSDVVEGNISPGVNNAAVNAGGKLLKCVELQIKYGSVSGDGQQKVLQLTPPATAPVKQIGG